MEWSQLLSSARSNLKQKDAEASRSAFEQDYDRIVFSHPFRRLQDKTQVHPLPEHDFVHTRLTHSLEVSSVGRSLAKKVGESVLANHQSLQSSYSLFDFGAIVAAAALTHDLGNPPFGHAGEDAISEFFVSGSGRRFQDRVTPAQWAEFIRFEGNAQGFRILNIDRYGLKLTNAVLGAFTKYPWTASASARKSKYGFFESELQTFAHVAEDVGLIGRAPDQWHRHPLAFLVEAADDICYSLIDLEDGCVLGLVSFEEARSLFSAVMTKSVDRLDRLDRLKNRNERIGYLRALAIGDLIEACSKVFLEHEKEILSGKFDAPLVTLTSAAAGLKDIIRVSREKIYLSRQVAEIEASGHRVLPGLLEAFVDAAWETRNTTPSRSQSNLFRLLPEDTALEIRQGEGDAYPMLRLIIDFVSGLTDRHALSLFGKIMGFPLR